MNFDKLKDMPSIKQVMTPFPHSIDAERPVAEALAMMRRNNFHHLPVMANGEPVGVISQREIRRALERPAQRPVEPPGVQLTVREVAQLEAYVVGLGEPLDRVLETMARKHLGAALVLKEGRLAGIFTLTDACEWFARSLRSRFPSSGGTDAA